MPSTYTRNLGVEKIGSGEQSGSWGDTTNDNFDIIDRAVNGVLSLSISGTSSTLTTNDGVLSDGQYKVIVLTGSPSGTHTITISPADAQKMYMVENNTAQTVIFTQGSGGNVSIAAGDSAIIYANGAGTTAAVANLFDDLASSSIKITGGSISGATASSLTVTSSTVNSTPVGNSSPSTGAFTTLSASGQATLSGTTQINGQLGLSGANYGTAGQALISGGPGNPPAWGSSFPAGGIIMWSGSIASIPSGWALCDGTGGTPNLTDRFVVGAGSSYAVGDTGGSDTTTLSEANLPAHTHSFSATTSTGGAHQHTQIYYQQTSSIGQSATGANNAGAATANYLTTNTGSSGAHSHTVSGTTGSTGSGTGFTNLPPYYALAYIMKL
jgi:microcystin-dependent protein